MESPTLHSQPAPASWEGRLIQRRHRLRPGGVAPSTVVTPMSRAADVERPVVIKMSSARAPLERTSPDEGSRYVRGGPSVCRCQLRAVGHGGGAARRPGRRCHPLLQARVRHRHRRLALVEAPSPRRGNGHHRRRRQPRPANRYGDWRTTPVLRVSAISEDVVVDGVAGGDVGPETTRQPGDLGFMLMPAADRAREAPVIRSRRRPGGGAVDGHGTAVREDPLRPGVSERDTDADDRLRVVAAHHLDNRVTLFGAQTDPVPGGRAGGG
jgi:hypothetical protein